MTLSKLTWKDEKIKSTAKKKEAYNNATKKLSSHTMIVVEDKFYDGKKINVLSDVSDVRDSL